FELGAINLCIPGVIGYRVLQHSTGRHASIGATLYLNPSEEGLILLAEVRIRLIDDLIGFDELVVNEQLILWLEAHHVVRPRARQAADLVRICGVVLTHRMAGQDHPLRSDKW